MHIRPIASSVAFAAGLATLPLSAAKAQDYPPQLAVCTVLADLRSGRRTRYRHDNHQRAAPSDHEGAALLLRVLRAAARLPIAGLSGAGKLRTAELFWATLSPPVPRRWHGSGRAAAGS
jgi:hypothetical protein